MYLRYSQEFNINSKFSIEPSLGAGFMKIASTAMDIDRKAKLLSKSNVYQTDFNLKLAYKNNGLEIYVKPIMKYATASLKFHDKIIIESLVDIKAKRKVR